MEASPTAGRTTSAPRCDVDEALLRALQKEHGGALLAYACRLTGDRGHAEDLVQETFLRAWRHAAALRRDGRPPRPWLFRVAANLANDRHRARRARPREVDAQQLAELPSREDPIDSALRGWQVADALAALSPCHREVLLETYYQDRTMAQTAIALAVPLGTVKSRRHFALRALRRVLEERGWPG